MLCPKCGAAILAQPNPVPNGTDTGLTTRPPRDGRHDDPAQTLPSTTSLENEPLDFSDDENTLPPPGTIGPALRDAVPGYEILGELGRGAMGVVYKARQLALRRLVALKMVLAGAHFGPTELKRFNAEAAAVATLQHPNIVQVYEVGYHEGRPYLSLEYVENGSLAQRLNGIPWQPVAAARLVERMARAMHYAHGRGIVHRDLKPANILLTTDGLPKVTDFGLAKQARPGASMTQSGTVIGTPSYMAPEQALGKTREVGPTADVYALGSILYELLTGRPPFRAETSVDTMLKVASEEPVPPSRYHTRLPRDLQTVCLKCLEKEPRKRYASAEALADDLRRFADHEPIRARPVGPMERAYKWARRRPTAAALAALGAFTILLCFAGVTFLWREEARQHADMARAEKDVREALQDAQAHLYANRIALAEREWLANNPVRARQLLEECAVERRQWEWHFLDHLCHSDLGTLHNDNQLPVLSMSFDAEGKYLAAADSFQALTVWDSATGAKKAHYPGARGGRVVATAFYEGMLLDAAVGRSVCIRDLAENKVVKDLRFPNAFKVSIPRPSVVTFSADRKKLALGGDRTVVWNLETGAVDFIPGPPTRATALAFNPSGDRLAIASAPTLVDRVGLVTIWDLSGAAEKTKVEYHKHTGTVNALAFSEDGELVASGGADRSVHVWRAADGSQKSVFLGHKDQITALAFQPHLQGNQAVASGGKDRQVILWDALTSQELFTIRGHQQPITCLAFSPDGLRLATAADDGLIKLWDAVGGQECRVLHLEQPPCVAYSPDGRMFAAATSTEIRLWSAEPGKMVNPNGRFQKLALPNRLPISAMAFSPDGKRLALARTTPEAGSETTLVHVLNTATGDVLLKLPASKSEYAIAYSPDGRLLASAGHDGLIRVWDADGHEITRLEGHKDLVYGLAFHPGSRLLASAGLDHSVRVWDLDTATVRFVLLGHNGPVRAVAFGDEGRVLASCADIFRSEDIVPNQGELFLWSMETGKEERRLTGHTGKINALAFTPDQPLTSAADHHRKVRLASVSEDQTVKLWDPWTGREVLTLRDHTGDVKGLAFRPDGWQLATVSTADQTVRLWDARPRQ
jgi:WD40 repeat protein